MRATSPSSDPTTPTSWSRSRATTCWSCGAGPSATTTARCSSAFAGQVAIAVQQRELRADAERAAGLAEANELRTALLAAVSHDLRTPLSSIKASVSSLLQRDVDFTPAATRELLETIDEGADRLNHLIGNLLDMSRLQTGALQLVMRDVGLDEVLPGRAGRPHAGRPGRGRRRRDAAARARRRRAARARDRQRGRERHRVVAARRRRCASKRASRRSGSTSTWSTAVPASRRRSARTSSARSSDWATAPTAAESGSASPWRAASSRRWVDELARRGHARRRRHHGHQLAGGDMTRVLVVDDEPQILRALGINLRARGYDVDLAPDGEHALDARGRPPSRRRGARPRPARHRRRRGDPRPARVEHGADRGAVGARR